jgi:hypothetical protein
MDYKYDDYEIDDEYIPYSFADLYALGRDGEVFECTESPVSSFVGTRIYVRGTNLNAGVVLVKPELKENKDASSLITPYGALTSGRFRKMKKKKVYTEIALSIAVRKINSGEPVFIRVTSLSDYKEIEGRFDSINSYGIHDFDDLYDAKFYIKL